LAGIYIHIPFCRQACNYCNFHFSTSLHKKDAFLIALKNEIAQQNDFISSAEKIETIYFGGGTPSLLKTHELDELLTVLHARFSIDTNAEITLEANPDDINQTILKEWMNAGINRLSLGIQSFDDEELKWMNRAHHANQALQSIDDIKEAGIQNFSVDLIFGGPLLSNKMLEKNIGIIAEKNIPHISAYALTVEEKTALHQFIKTKKSPPVNTEKQAEQFLLTMKLLAEAGYEHYEISNYAKHGMRSKHNSSYWKGKPYHGFGPSAHSFNGINKRRWNISNNTIYISQWSEKESSFEEELLSETQQLNEYIMTSLRTMEGIELEKISKSFGKEKAQIILTEANKYLLTGKITMHSGCIKLTTEGKLFADGISADLFFD
jgi:oxygen-independent coproporphyrinogen-3 oxidase